jgi:glyoxylase-like metal-dependent hydrolase (beta-lactamase superfamily II)
MHGPVLIAGEPGFQSIIQELMRIMTDHKHFTPIIHRHASGEAGILANAYLVETANGIVGIDATLTKSESKALRGRIDEIDKPLLAMLITHAHPDHVAGIANVVDGADTPIYALPAVIEIARASVEPKRAQWKPVFGDEWIDEWTLPNTPVSDGEAVSLDGVTYRVHDLGAGGDSDANAIWIMESEPGAAFVGDLVFNGTHTYLADGAVLAWLANIERYRPLLSEIFTIYPGHGAPAGPELLDAQRDYILAYVAAVRELLGADGALSDEAVSELERRMHQERPDAPLDFMISLSANAVARELSPPS